MKKALIFLTNLKLKGERTQILVNPTQKTADFGGPDCDGGLDCGGGGDC